MKSIKNKNILGIDIGSVSLSSVELTPDKNIQNVRYLFHGGKIHQTLNSILNTYELPNMGKIAYTSDTPGLFVTGQSYNGKVCIIRAAKHFYEKIGSILVVGGEKFELISFDESGRYKKIKTNTSCASGTGSFLDQQARRLSLTDSSEISSLAMSNKEEVPKIATRCAVFAKTDLTHAQQDGYSLPAICQGLCRGMSINLINALISGEKPPFPIVFAGGVSKNTEVSKELAEILKTDLLVHNYSHLFGAIGAALLCQQEEYPDEVNHTFNSPKDILTDNQEKKTYFYSPLNTMLSSYPDFSNHENFMYEISGQEKNPVEVDIYNLSSASFIGVDVGSTSTKAVLMDEKENIIAGFYTRTAGQPIVAVQSIFKAMIFVFQKYDIPFSCLGVATTGSGRKFIQKVLGADLAVDEITAHAKAAFMLNPEIDTIIEIGGQDSKFTTMKNGQVTFSTMNYVCAAGTGSFIEELAGKLNCSLSQYSELAIDVHAPLSSDRCTVFMERDINHFLNKGYSTGEILAAVLYSVRDNYLSKVAIEKYIGNKICFQGATAKNKALVMAFEKRLNKPIYVSKYCHLTGAIGAALLIKEAKIENSSFKGLEIYKQNIPVSTEICHLCNNLCKIRICEVDNSTVAFGFQCGRDYETKKFVDRNTSGFDLNKTRKQVYKNLYNNAASPLDTEEKTRTRFTIGIPATLYILEEIQLWQYFFNYLSIPFIVSQSSNAHVEIGKNIAGAEFCIAMSALHGHVKSLINKVDYIFLPVANDSMDRKSTKEPLLRYCYYSQFAPAAVSIVKSLDIKNRCMMPFLNFNADVNRTKKKLHHSLSAIPDLKVKLEEVSLAYDKAVEYHNLIKNQLKEVFKESIKDSNGISVVLFGRPYTVLDPCMNKKIPEIFASFGIKTFFQDMISYSNENFDEMGYLTQVFHWHYSSQILKAAKVVAGMKGVYPVLMSSFKCTPDSYVIDAFKILMEKYHKPYLILQLDEHDSSTGYETRIESGIRSFNNHFHSTVTPKVDILSENIKRSDLREKTLLLPCWDPIACKLIVASLKESEIDARLLEEDNESIKESLKYNDGQCLPFSAIGQGVVNYINKYKLDPSNVMIWTIDSGMACNLKLGPYYMKRICQTEGNGFENISIYPGDVLFTDISTKIGLNAYFSYFFAGMLKLAGCKIRPYEINKGETDSVLEECCQILYYTFLIGASKRKAAQKVVSMLKKIPIKKDHVRPKIAIFGDFYSRDNPVLNQDIIHQIEAAGGEVITTPYTYYIRIMYQPYIKKWMERRVYMDVVRYKSLFTLADTIEKQYYRYFQDIITEPFPEYEKISLDVLKRYNIHLEQEGETFDNLLKIYALIEHYPDIDLFVQANPSLCCPSIVTEAIAREIESDTGIPILTITYDGTAGNKNETIIPYIKLWKKEKL